jgi:DNA-binding transcriptional LysR family regulator
MGTPPEDTNIQSEVIGTHRLIFVAHPNHPLCQLDRELTPKELIKHQLIAREVGSGTRLAMAAYFGALFHQATRPPIVLDTNEGIKQSILAGMGISLLSDATCELELNHGLLKTLPVEGTPLDRQWYAVRLANLERNPAEQSLLRFLAMQAER